uniref:Zgc:153044 n=1 Tax=Scleropages formosus TaxID=113540 RepID=A0A8C9S014_SCLFO
QNQFTQPPFRVPKLAGLGQITEHVFLSNSKAANNGALITALNITCIINATKKATETPVPAVDYVWVPVADCPDAPLSAHFEVVAERIRAETARSGRTLVYCNAGVSRSAALCLAYLVRYGGMTLAEAHRWVKARRPIVRPNPGFWKQLIKYEHEVHGRSTVEIIQSAVGEIPDVYEQETKDLIPC